MATATRVRRSYRGYETQGNVAYDERVLDQSVAVPRTEPLVRPRERVRSKAQVRVRQAGYVAPTAVIGFVLVAVMAILVLVSYVNITDASNRVVHLRNESAALTEEHSKLLAQYELAFDLKSVEEQVTANGTMVQPQAGQLVTLDMAEPDSVYVYDTQGENILVRFWENLTGAVDNVVAFFR